MNAWQFMIYVGNIRQTSSLVPEAQPCDQDMTVAQPQPCPASKATSISEGEHSGTLSAVQWPAHKTVSWVMPGCNVLLVEK